MTVGLLPQGSSDTVAATRRLLICSAGVPHPSRGASTVLFYHYLARLKREGYAVRHILLLEGEAWSDEAVAAYEGAMGDADFEVMACRSRQFVEQGRFRHRLDAAAAAAARRAMRDFAPGIILAFDLLAA